ncbi:hypothetical protein K2X14_07475 [Acetobacter sp. TBRC 12305]|uniref:Uncharacterized protein n=1 Tax=Acetobacter garciniae TaxID=2817435 RepID=A0A939HIF2_9PROT|nr:hypothetical protein [Acetobacter garciniae]MBO1324980.1 hypothetical protein [Acetobacter garciniae]MBX0344671.1 hypothetical protein [Acetobacter garciniae]
MSFKFHSLLLGTALVATPALALAQAGSNTAPTANSAASQVGKSPPAAQDKSGKRVEPSDKLWNNPRTVDEQPGTQPPPNNKPADSSETTKAPLAPSHTTQPGKYKSGTGTYPKTTPPHAETSPEN